MHYCTLWPSPPTPRSYTLKSPRGSILQQHWHMFCSITSSNTPFYRHSGLLAFAVYICSLTSVPGHNLTFCYWKHDTEQFVRVIIMWSSPTERSWQPFLILSTILFVSLFLWSIRKLLLRNTKWHCHIGGQGMSGVTKAHGQTPYSSTGQESFWLNMLIESQNFLFTGWKGP